ncbi:TPA: patatin-like phospholipase family protein [Yersinia enterocolitica]
MLECPLYKRFDLVFGTSTGAIIAALIALGYEVDQIHELYTKHVPRVMPSRLAVARTMALQNLAKEVFQDKTFEDVLMGIGIVATQWMTERPMIFKGSVVQAPWSGRNLQSRIRGQGQSYIYGG